MNNAMLGRDIYLRHTNTAGVSFVQCHRVWDAERFIASQQAAAAKLNEDVKGDLPRLAKVEQITDKQYESLRPRK